MKTVIDWADNYKDCIINHMGFEKYSQEYPDDTVLFLGYGSAKNEFARFENKNFNRKVFFNGEQPCAFLLPEIEGNYSADKEDYFNDIYTICPYSAKWLNHIAGDNKFKPVLFPINEDNIGSSFKKKNDAIFYGGVHCPEHEELINTISKYNYKFVTMGPEYWSPNFPLKDRDKLISMITDKNVINSEKWQILRETRIVPVYNWLPINDTHIQNIKKYDRWEENEAFSHLEMYRAPQLKPRISEAAFFRMLMVVQEDPWNVIEEWFVPGKHFIYYKTESDLIEICDDALKNPEKYQSMVDSAYHLAVKEYTTRSILKKIMNKTPIKQSMGE
jgi:hypothetical protein